MASDHRQEEMRGNMVVSSTGYCYSDVSSTNPNLVGGMQSFGSNNNVPTEIYGLPTDTSMDQLMGFPAQKMSNNNNSMSQHDGTSPHSVFWKGSSSSSKPITDNQIQGVDFYQQQQQFHHHHDQSNRLMVDESSLMCVFPCEPNERPSQGLSLSLSSTNPSSIGLQSFELRQDPHHQQPQGYFGKSMTELIQEKDGFLGKTAAVGNHQLYNHQSQQYNIRSSRYLVPAQELLTEFCNLGTKPNGTTDHSPKKQQWQQQQDQENNNPSSSKNKALYSLEFLELQKRKTELLQMLEDVDRRYKHYCDQMKAVVSSFEAVAGNGAATVYSALASKAMSRHFRCLRDGIVGQIKATKKAMGDKDTAAPGTTRGETPRLRILDQTLRQQRAFQQMTMMESHPWRPQRGLPERSVSVLRAWLFEHFLHPYPSDVDKHILARQTGLSRSQVSNWFINARVRLWKPMVEEMYMEETKENDQDHTMDQEDSPDGFTAVDQTRGGVDQKPTPDQLVRIDSECLSSIINHPEKTDPVYKLSANKALDHHDFHQGFARATNSFGAVELDFSSYNHHHSAGFGGGGGGVGGSGTGGGVSLTLGLQQHGGGGVSLAFSPMTPNSLFYPRDHMEDCQTVQYSLLDGDQGQNLPYRNLMGAQLLHDLAG